MSQIPLETPTGSQTKVDTHNTSGAAHADIRGLITAAIAGVPEQARDAVGAALVQGTGVTITVNDAGDTITIAAAAGYTDEQAQDAVAAMIAAGTHSDVLTFTYDDAGNALSLTIAPVDPTLIALANLATGANKLPYSTGTDTFAQTDFTPFARTLLDDANAATALGTLGAAADSATVHNTGAETVAGVKTFSSAPVVPAASFPESAVTNLVSDLAAKAPLASPALTGTPTAPTAIAATNTTQLATTAFVQLLINNLINGAPGTLDTLKEIADQLATDESAVGALTTTVAGKQPLDAELTALAALVSAANKLPYFTGSGAAALADLTAAGRALIDDADASAQLTTLGVSSFIKTLLDDADAATALATIGAIAKSLVTAKGDLLVATASGTVVALPVSGNNGWVLTEDSAQTDGIKWAAGAGGGDLPEFASSAQTAAVGTPANMVGKITRYDTTSGAISQPFPAATAGEVVSIGWDTGANTLTLTGASRADTCATTSGSATVTDASVLAADLGRVVTGAGIPASTYVGTVTPGASFLLSSSPTSQVNVLATATAGSVSLTITDAFGSGIVTAPVVPLSGEVITYHCTTAGRWRVVSGFKPQTSLDTRFLQVVIPTDKTADFTLALTDSGSIGCSSASAITATLPPNSSVAFPVGTPIELRQVGAGRVAFAAGAGVTLRAADGYVTTRVQYSAMVALKVATDTWSISGDVAA